MSIRIKLLLGMFFIVFIPVLFISEASYFNTKQQLEKTLLTALETVTKLKADKIELFFDGMCSDLAIIQNSPNTKHNLFVLNRFIEDRTHPDFLTATDSLNQSLKAFTVAKGFIDVVLLNSAGVVIYTTGNSEKFQNIGHSIQYLSDAFLAQSRSDIVLSRVISDPRPGHSSMMVAAGSLQDDEGHFIGFVLLALDMEEIYTLIQDRTGIGRTGETLIARKDDDQVLFLSPFRHEPKTGYSKQIKVDQKVAIPMQEAIQGRKGSGIALDYRGKEVISAWTYVPRLAWGLVTKIDTDEAFASIAKSRNISTILILLTLALISVFIVWLARSITAPIIALQHGVRFFGEGNLEYRLSINSKDEIGELGQAFNSMADSLAESYRNLEKKVRERTEDLEKSRIAALTSMDAAKEEKSRAEKALASLKESSQTLRELFLALDQSPICVYITDFQGKIKYINPKFIEVTGYSKEEAIGQSPRILTSNQHPDEFFQNLWETITSGNTWQGEISNKRKDAQVYWANTSISPITNEQGEISDFVAIMEDVTEKKQINNDLNLQVKELAKAKSSMLNIMEDLAVANQEAEVATKAKSDFLANMSHEIRTPMNAIIGLSYLTLRTNLTPKQQDYVGKIQSSANALLGVINDVLDFSKIEAGKLNLESVEFQLKDVLNSVSTLITQKAEEKGLEVILSTPQNIPMALVGDPLRLGQVLTNLAVNAVKFTETGEVLISVDAVKERPEKITLRFSVRDTGIGMSEKQVDKLFQAFSQADTSTTRKYGGTGLGLSISKQLVALMGGEMTVQSVEGEGSLFCFTVVLGVQPEQKQEKHLVYPPISGLKTLIADGNKTALKVLQEILESFKLNVTAVSSGEACLAELNQASEEDLPFDLILIDSSMPVLNGFEVFRRVIQDKIPKEKAIFIMIPDYGRGNIRQQDKQIGLPQFLPKPVTPSTLLNTFTRLFSSETGDTTTSETDTGLDLVYLQPLQGARILLVEDNAINQQVAQAILQRVGLLVEIAGNGKEALGMLEENQYDAILMDIQMPVLDGKAATREIRKRELSAISNPPVTDECSPSKAKTPTPIIAMTAHAMTGAREKSLAAGMNDHITKPIEPEELYTCLLRWIKPKSDGQTPAVSIQGSGGIAENKKPADAAPLDFPQSISGIDLEAGLKRMLGNKKLYLKLLRDFQQDSEHFSEQVLAALDNKDMETAQRLVHTLKGVSGNLGMISLQEKALVLESAIMEQPKNLKVQLNNTRDELQAVLEALRRALPAEQDRVPKEADSGESFDVNFLTQKMKELGKLLEQSDMDAEEVFLEIRTALSADYPEQTSQLALLLDSLDFKQALKLLQEIETATDAESLFANALKPYGTVTKTKLGEK